MSQKCHSLLWDRRGRQTAQLATLAYDFQRAHVIPEHFHPEDQLIFASSGVMTVRTKQGIWVVPPLRAVWIPAKTPHWWKEISTKTVGYYAINIESK